MPAGLTETDRMFSVREKPWHGLGVVLDRAPRSIDEALELAGLDWDVVQEPVYYPVPDCVPSGALDPDRLMVAGNGRVFARIPDSPKRERGLDIEVDPNPGLRNRRVNVRSDNGEPLGEVSTSYPVVNNRQAFAFLSNLIGSELHFETAGSLWGGRRIWVMAKAPDWIEIGGDTVETYLCVDTRHDGQGCVRGIVAPIRVVCQNTLHAAVQSAQQSFKVKHTGDATRALADARTAMEITLNYAEQFKAMGDRLASESASSAKVQEVLRELYPIDESVPKQTRKNRIASRETITEILRQEGPTVGNAPGSKWALLNVLCEYIDFYGGRRERDVNDQARRERTFRSAVDDSTGMKARAYELVAN
jgi:phage/plasmid-like protein (TIGR03299 family)